MGRPPVIPAETKFRIVLSILAGGIRLAEAARVEKLSEPSIGRLHRRACDQRGSADKQLDTDAV